MLNELDYPFDPKYLISHEKKLRRSLKADGVKRIPKRIAILGGSTTHDLKLVLELFLLNYGIEPEFYESEYNQFYEDGMFLNPVLEEFRPDVIWIHTTNRNITAFPSLKSSTEEIDSLYKAELDKFTGLWNRLSEVYVCPIVQNNFEPPLYRLMGNRDISDPHGAGNFINRLNTAFYRYASEHDNFHICDIAYLAADYGLKEWSDPYYWYLYKYALNLYAIPSLSFQVANIVKSVFGKNKKGFVLDLDNTLWGGVVGDDGPEGLELGPEEAVGEAYLEFQRYLKAHTELGILLNVDSKNDNENALAGLNHPDGALRPEDFIEIVANWESKDRNFAKIAEGLSLMPESLVFVDDNPAERAIVKQSFPEVSVPEIGEVRDYILTLDRSGFFECTSLSGDDMARNEMYRANAKRAAVAKEFSDYREYLLSLEMEAVIRPFEQMYFSRIAQLSNKSNQFNLTTKRFTVEEIVAAHEDPDRIDLYGRLMDRFGDNGVVSIVIGRIEEGVCHIELWLMSCRVLKRDMEAAMMDALAGKCMERVITEIRGYYYPTEKNKMVRDFYALQGFEKLSEDEEGNTVWSLSLKEGYSRKNTVIKTES